MEEEAGGEADEPWAEPWRPPPPAATPPGLACRHHGHHPPTALYAGAHSGGGFTVGRGGGRGGGGGGGRDPLASLLGGWGEGGESEGGWEGGGGERVPQPHQPHQPYPALPTTSSALRGEAEAALARWGGGRGRGGGHGRGGVRGGRVAKPARPPPAPSRTTPSAVRPALRSAETPPPTGKNAFWAWRRRGAERARDREGG